VLFKNNHASAIQKRCAGTAESVNSLKSLPSVIQEIKKGFYPANPENPGYPGNEVLEQHSDKKEKSKYYR